MRSTILFDSQVFDAQVYGGISRYFYEMIRRLRRDPLLDARLGFTRTRNQYLLGDSALGLEAARVGPSVMERVRRRLRLPERKRGGHPFDSTQLIRGDYAIFHPTYFDTYFLEEAPRNRPFVLTVYDMIPELYPEFFGPGRVLQESKRELARKADRIFAISETTRDDLARIVGLEPSRIVVTPLASSIRKPQGPNEKGNYLLYTGKRDGYKNFVGFLRAAAEVLHAQPGIRLLCCGGGSFGEDELQLLRELDLADRVGQVDAPEHEMAGIYSSALALVFPSLYEGFGLPVLEAFACGCPVIAADAGSIPEVAGDACAYFDPTSEASMADALRILLTDRNCALDLIRRGEEREKEFSWDRTFDITRRSYLELLH